MSMTHEELCKELYDLGNLPKDVPDGLVVVGADKCVLCKNSMRNNNYADVSSDGTHITWIDIDQQDGLYKFYTIPGITYDEEKKTAMAGGKPTGFTPVYLWVEDGAVKRPPVAAGELPEGGIDALIEKIRSSDA